MLGVVRLIVIILSVAILADMSYESQTAFFRGIFTFYMMLCLDYAKFIILKDKFAKFVGITGLIFSIPVVLFSTLGLFDILVIEREVGEYMLRNAETFKLIPINVKLDTFVISFSYSTVAVATLELLNCPFVYLTDKLKHRSNKTDMKRENTSYSQAKKETAAGVSSVESEN